VGALWLAARKIDMHPAIKSLIGSTLGMAALQVINSALCVHLYKYFASNSIPTYNNNNQAF
jgi:hypothetical protein